LKDLEDKIKEEDKKEIQEKIEELKKIKNAENTEEIKQKTQEASQIIQKAGAEIYKKQSDQEKPKE